MNRNKKVFVCGAVSILLLACAVAVYLVGLIVIHNEISYPNYIASQPKQTFKNDYFEVEVTSYITNLTIDGTDVTAYYNIFNCEENYAGDWELELVTNQSKATYKSYWDTPLSHLPESWRNDLSIEQDGITVIQTESILLTYDIKKTWTFYPDKPYFTVEITKTYRFDSENLNNQIIVDVQNSGFNLENESTLTFNLQNSQLTIQILESSKPVSWQLPSETTDYTEAQINIDGQSDRTERSHFEGEIETVKLKVTIN